MSRTLLTVEVSEKLKEKLDKRLAELECQQSSFLRMALVEKLEASETKKESTL